MDKRSIREGAKQKLTPLQQNVCLFGGTEAPFDNAYWDNHQEGIYHCVVCGVPLFASEAKFDSGTGWPSYFQPISPELVHSETDTNMGMVREEVTCANCGSHLGHVFNDLAQTYRSVRAGGPTPTGLRYCINSAALEFEPR